MTATAIGAGVGDGLEFVERGTAQLVARYVVAAPLAGDDAVVDEQQAGVGADDGLQRDVVELVEGIVGARVMSPAVDVVVGILADPAAAAARCRAARA